jgi:hypothetical protein
MHRYAPVIVGALLATAAYLVYAVVRALITVDDSSDKPIVLAAIGLLVLIIAALSSLTSKVWASRR